mmetsp:Transcript_134412/g.318637  ORF Transcript_134412/g.318637 Transcript_134412/m.318637 type:complete len:232 (+) Transcript_134412:773-1468(+)
MCSRHRNRLEWPGPPQQHEHTVPAEAGEGLEERSPGPKDLWELISGWLHTQGKGNKQGAARQELCQGCRSVILGVGQKDVLRGCGSMGDNSTRRHHRIHHGECCARPQKNLVDSATVRVVKLPVDGNRHMLTVQGAQNDRPSLGQNMQRARSPTVHDDLHMLIVQDWAAKCSTHHEGGHKCQAKEGDHRDMAEDTQVTTCRCWKRKAHHNHRHLRLRETTENGGKHTGQKV